MHDFKIIPNFISLITTNYGQERKGAGDIQSIVVNPNSKIGSIHSRLLALQSFHQFIHQLLRRQESEYWYFEGYNVRIESLIPVDLNFFDFESKSILKYLPRKEASPFKTNLFSFATKTNSEGNRIKIGILHTTKTQLSTRTPEQEIKNQYRLDNLEELENLVNIMMPAMISFWIESFPLGFPVGIVCISPNMLMLNTIIQLANLIWRSYILLLKVTLNL